MPITVFCQECGKNYLAKDEQAGMRVRCPAGHVMEVPAATPFAGQGLADPLGGDPTQINPYASPGYQSGGYAPGQPLNRGKVMAPAIAMLVVGGMGLCAAIFSCIWSMVATPPPVDPDAPPFVQQFMQGGVGPLALAIQGVFLIVNGLIIAGGIQMLRLTSYTLSTISTILAMINIGNCCCLIGVPVGIWGLVILLQPDVKAAFAQRSRM